MKFRYGFFWLTILLVFACAGPLYANADSFKKGEWAAIAENYKLRFVQLAIDDLKALDVPVAGSPEDYLRDLDEIYDKSSGSSEIVVSDILPSIVYRKEPGTRKIMDGLIKKHQLAQIDPAA